MILSRRKRQGSAGTGSLWETGLVTAVSAGAAGSVAAVLTTPIDVVKTRIMLSAADERGGQATADGRKVWDGGEEVKGEKELARLEARKGKAGGYAVGKEILRTEGVKGLFRGGALRGLWTALGSGLYLGVYESGRKYLENRRVGSNDGQTI